MSQRSALAHGSQRLRDLFVCLLATCVITPVILLAPRACAVAGLLWVALFVTPAARWILGRIARAPSMASQEEVTSWEVAVLGGGFGPQGALSPRSARRLRHAVALAARSGRRLTLCGGTVCGERTEAVAMAELARAEGFTGPLRLEEHSRTTFENVAALAALGGRLLVVTCPQHSPRVARLARLFGADLEVSAYPLRCMPRGVRTDLGLAVECFYEMAIHAWLTLRQGLVLLGLRQPLRVLGRRYLEMEPTGRS